MSINSIHLSRIAKKYLDFIQLLPTPLTGASPLKGKKTLSFPNSSARRLFPIRRRPLRTTRQARPDFDKSSSLRNSLSLPTNGFIETILNEHDTDVNPLCSKLTF